MMEKSSIASDDLRNYSQVDGRLSTLTWDTAVKLKSRAKVEFDIHRVTVTRFKPKQV